MAGAADSYVAPAAVIREAFGELSSDELVFIAQQCLELGASDHALALCNALAAAEDATPGIALCRAVAQFLAGDRETALAAVERLLAAPRRPLPALGVKAEMLLRAGERDLARATLLELVERYPDYPRALGVLATLFLPGPHYRDVLARVHQQLRPRCYLEIGVDTGATLALAERSELGVGVDPAETPLARRLPPNLLVFREESDHFFAERQRESLFGSRRVDLAFIDGMHQFEQALRDFSNAESWAHAGGTILLHDCVPIVARTASRVRSTKFWVGDTWKVVLALAAYRPELKLSTVLTPPSGLVVVRRLNPGSNVLRERFDEIIERFAGLEYERAPGDFAPELNPVPNDEGGLALALKA
jgi:tetratricopeptide (TPR) repeat protein